MITRESALASRVLRIFEGRPPREAHCSVKEARHSLEDKALVFGRRAETRSESLVCRESGGAAGVIGDVVRVAALGHVVGQ